MHAISWEATALLVIAHGSRSEEANDDTRHLAEALRGAGPFRWVVPAFLELAEPDIDGGAAECVRLGASRIIMLPHFLAPGLHVRHDLAEARDRLARRYPGVDVLLAEPVGRHPLLVDILKDRALATVVPPKSGQHQG